jgi:hypothetical protein
MPLNQILELLNKIIDAIKEVMRLKRVKELKDAKEETLDTKDQRTLENALGGSSGPTSDNKYPGMFTRERKKTKE